MTERTPDVSRWRHFRASLSRQSRGRGKDTIAIVILATAAIAMTLWIITQQKAALPSWAPFIGEDFVSVTADFTSAQSVVPGQGQAVTVAGVRIGKVSSVDVEEGRAVVGLDLQPEYQELIRTDATLLLRPKTNLNDMVVEVDPGTAPEHVEEGHNFPLSQTEPNIGFEGFLSTLDEDTRRYLQLLVAGTSQGIGGRGRQLSGVFRRLEPFAHYIADLNKAVAQRREALAQVIHDFGRLTTELGRRDAQIERFVTSSKDALGDFANVQGSIQESLVEFPPMLKALDSAMYSANRFATTARPALIKLIPQAQALGPAFEAQKRFFAQTTGPIRDQIRPFTRQVRPVLKHTAEGSDDFNRAVRGFGNALGGFNNFLNLLAFKPKDSRESFLFYVPWLNRNFGATFNLDDAGGPIQRQVIMISCNGAYLASGVSSTKPYLRTLLRAARIRAPTELPPVPPDPQLKEISCGPK